MTKLSLEIHDDVVTTINKIKNINDAGVEVEVPGGSVLFENILNLKLIKSFGEKNDISVQFHTNDPTGNDLLSMLNGNGGVSEIMAEELEEIGKTSKFKLPKVSLAGLSLPRIRIPTIGKSIFLVLILGVAAGAYYMAGKKLPQAEAKMIVDYSHLTRSLTVRVTTLEGTNAEKKTLAGTALTTTITDSSEIETTGEKLVGEKAKGEVTLYNNTDDEKKLEKGLVLTGDNDREYILDDTVTIPARTQLAPDPTDPSIISYQKGEANADIIAGDIGEEYNIDSGEELDIEDHKSSEFTAFTATDIDGGSSKTVKVVSEEDIESLSGSLKETLISNASGELKKQQQTNKKFIEGSTLVEVTDEAFSHSVGEETDKLTLTQTARADGLAYDEKDLNSLTDKLVEDLVPEDFELSDKEREVNVEILGNSTNSVLSSKEADIQVTLKSFVLPIIDEEDLKLKLKGKSAEEAQKVIGSIKNIRTYQLDIKPNLPLFRYIPNDLNRIHIEIEREG